MKIVEKIIIVLVVFSLIMKINIMHGGGLLLVISLSTLACIYFPLGIMLFNAISLKDAINREAYKEVTRLKMFLSIVLGMGMAAICMGIMFKMLQWPLPNINLIAGITLLLIVLLIAVIRIRKSDANYFSRIVKRIVIIGIVGILFICTPYLTIEKIRFRNHPEYINAYEKHLKDPGNKELKKKVRLEHDRAIYSNEEFRKLHPEEEE